MTKPELIQLLNKTNPTDLQISEINLYESTIESQSKQFLSAASSLAKTKRNPAMILVAISKH
jgi:hypothetical protein